MIQAEDAEVMEILYQEEVTAFLHKLDPVIFPEPILYELFTVQGVINLLIIILVLAATMALLQELINFIPDFILKMLKKQRNNTIFDVQEDLESKIKIDGLQDNIKLSKLAKWRFK